MRFLIAVIIILLISCGKRITNGFIKYSPSVQDYTELINNAIESNDTVILDSGIYDVRTITISSNKVIKTDGFGTILRQQDNVDRAPIVQIMGSNVIIDSLTIFGQIRDSDNEFNHALQIGPDIENPELISNIQISAIRARNIRGDGVYIGSRISSIVPREITISNINVRNCYRQGISISAGENITISQFHVDSTGLNGICVETNANGQIVDGVLFKNGRVGSINLVGDSSNSVRNLTFQGVGINGDYLGSDPVYQSRSISNGIHMKNVNNINFHDITIENTSGSAVVIRDGKKNRSDSIFLDRVHIERCGILPNNHNALIYLAGPRTVSISRSVIGDHFNDIGILGTRNDSLDLVLDRIFFKGGCLAKSIGFSLNRSMILSTGAATFDLIGGNTQIYKSYFDSENVFISRSNAIIFDRCDFTGKFEIGRNSENPIVRF